MERKVEWLCKNCAYGVVWTEHKAFTDLAIIRAYCTLSEMEIGNVADCNSFDDDWDDEDED